MKKLIGVSALAICMCGCATQGVRYNPEAWYTPSEVDIGKIAAVNQWAQVHGATVMWINYPPKPKAEQVAGN